VYSAPNGTYGGGSYIVNGYSGDWIIVKLPYQIILSRFRFYARPGINSRSPGLWRCYGSNNGSTFTEITEASNSTTQISSATYDTYYEKRLTTFNTPYLYIGWTINKLVGGNSSANMLNFAEIQIFGKERIQSYYYNKTETNTLLSNKQDNLTFTNPLKKDVSNNISIDLSGYNIGNIKGNKAIINEGYLDPSGNGLNFYHNIPGTYFVDNGFNSYFNLSSVTAVSDGNTAIVPFITNYNRMFKNGINNAIKIASTGSANSNVNSSTYILLDSGGDPNAGTNVGTIKFNIATQAQGAIDRFVINPTSSIFYNNVGIGKTPSAHLDVSGHLNVSLNLYTTSIIPLGNAQDLNIRTRTTGNLNLASETGNIYLNTSSINRFRVDPSGNIYSYGNFDVSGNIKALGKITTSSLDVSGIVGLFGLFI
jgi:hypothetical protein